MCVCLCLYVCIYLVGYICVFSNSFIRKSYTNITIFIAQTSVCVCVCVIHSKIKIQFGCTRDSNYVCIYLLLIYFLLFFFCSNIRLSLLFFEWKVKGGYSGGNNYFFCIRSKCVCVCVFVFNFHPLCVCVFAHPIDIF